MQALVKRTVAALKKNQATVIQQINRGDKQWKDGDYYMVVGQGTKLLAHGYIPWAAGMDVGDPINERRYPWIKLGLQMIEQKGEGCIQYKFMNPAKGGQVEDKVTYFVKVSGSMWAASGTYLVRK